MSQFLSALGFKMKAAGIDTDSAALHAAGVEALRAHANSPHAAVHDFQKAVIEGGGMAAALIRWDEDESYDLCLSYLRMIALDMTGNRLPGGGLVPRGTPDMTASSRQPNEDEEGHSRSAGQAAPNLPSSSSPNRQIGPSAAHLAGAKTVAKEAAKTIYDTFKTGEGRAWGDVGAHELKSYNRDGATARIFLKVVGPKIANAKPSEQAKPLRHILTEEEFKACAERAKKAMKTKEG